MDILKNPLADQQEPETEKDLSKNKLDKKQEISEDPRLEGLSHETIRQIESGIKTINEVERDQKHLKQEIEKELLQIQKTNPKLMEEKEYSAFLKETEEKKDPEERKKILERVKRFPEEKAEKKRKENEKPNEKFIKEKKDDLSKLFASPETAKWLGTKEIKQWESWATEAVDKAQTIKAVEDTIKKMHENRTNGINPRKEYFENTLNPMLKKYGLTLNDTPYLKTEGLSERKASMELTLRTEKKLEGMKNAGLYSIKAVREIMSELLKSDNLSKQKETVDKIEQITAKEAQSYTNINSSIFDETMVINDMTIRKMSKKSKKLALDAYKDFGLKQRAEAVINWQKFIDDEAKLTKDLGAIYKNDRKGFKNALKIFELLDFTEKEKFIETQKILVAEQDKETIRKGQEIVFKAVSAIDTAKEKKDISNITAKKFKALFLDPKIFIDPKTGKIDPRMKKINLDKLQKGLDQLTSEKPVFEATNRNLKAYEIERENFAKMHEKLKKDNPEISLEELKNWTERYDGETFSNRKKVFQDLIKEINDRKKKKSEQKKVEKETGITEKEKKETKEKTPERSELIVFVNDCLAENTEDSIKEAYKALHLYKLANEEKAENDPTFLYLEETVARRKREMITTANKNKKKSVKITDAVERVTDSQTFKEKIDESNIREINTEQTRKNQRRHHEKVSAKDRALEESKDQAGNNEEKKKVIEEYYELTDKEHILKTEDRETGKKMTDIKFNNVKMTREQIEKNKREIRGKKERITKNKGFKDVRIMDEKGKELKAEEAKAREDKLQEKLDNQIVEEAEKIAGTRRKVEKPEDSFSNVQDRIAMMREARRLRQEKKEEMLKKAA